MKFIGVMVLALFGTLFVSAAFSHADQAKLVNVTPLVCSEGGDHNISRAHTTRLGANNLRAVCLIWGAGTYPQAYLEVYHVTDPAYVPRQGMTKWRYDLYVGYAEYTMTRKWTWERPAPPRKVIPPGGSATSSQSPQQDSPTGDEPSGDEPSGDDPVTPPSDDPEDDNNGGNNGGNNGNNNGGGSSCNNGIGNGGDGCDPGNSGDTPNGGQDD